MIQAMASRLQNKAKNMTLEKLKKQAMDRLSQAGDRILTAPERMFDGETLDEDFVVQPIQHHSLMQSQAQFMPLNQMQGMPMQQVNPYGSATQNMGLMELLEQAARMR
jgi:cellobiose-specific phosphotransferase system component IIB